MICKNCGSDIANGSKFCPECGAKQGCPNCGFQNLPSNSKFCPECGFNLIAANAPAPVPESQKSDYSAEIQQITPYIDSLIEKMLYQGEGEDPRCTPCRPMFTAEVFRHVFIANAIAEDNKNIVHNAFTSTISGERFCDYTKTADQLIEELKNELLLVSPQCQWECEIIRDYVQNISNRDLSNIEIDEYADDDLYLKAVSEEFNSLCNVIRKQASLYPSIVRAIEKADAESKDEGSSGFIKNGAGVVKKGFSGYTAVNGLLNGDWGAVIRGGLGLLDSFSGKDSDDDKYEDYYEIVDKLKELVGDSNDDFEHSDVGVAYQFEWALDNFHTDMIRDADGLRDRLINGLCVPLLNEGVSVNDIIQAFFVRNGEWESYCATLRRINKLSADDEDDDEDDEKEQNDSLDTIGLIAAMLGSDEVSNEQYQACIRVISTTLVQENSMVFRGENTPSVKDANKSVIEAFKEFKRVCN